jgi:hypothetical protein
MGDKFVRTIAIAVLSVLSLASAVRPASSADRIFEAGTYSSGDPGFRYQGSWSVEPSHFKNRTATAAADIGATVSFSIRGNQIRIFRAYDPDQGRVRICVDSKCREVGNASFYRLTEPQPWSLILDTGGEHRVSIELVTGRFVFAGIEVLANDAVLQRGRYDDTDERIALAGSWFLQRRDGPWKGTVHSSIDGDASASFRFSGHALVIGVVLYDDRGDVQICIDGACRTRAVFSPGLRWQEPIVVAGLGEGEHTAVLRKTSGKLFDLDYVEVVDGAPLTAGLHEADDPGVFHVGDWKPDGSRRLRSISANAAVYLRFRGRGVRWRLVRDEFGGVLEACINSSCHRIDALSAEPRVDTITLEAPEAAVNTFVIRKIRGRALYSAGFEIF